MKKHLSTLWTIAIFLLPQPAYATMPQLSDKPQSISPSSCQKWAATQDDDAIETWGIQEDGSSSKALAHERLTGECLGQPAPEIVGFGSSVGFDDSYCQKHIDQKICSNDQPSQGDNSAQPSEAPLGTAAGDSVLQGNSNDPNLFSPALTPHNIQESRVWVTFANICIQNPHDDWIQCKLPNGELLVQFRFLLGFMRESSTKRFITQKNLERLAQAKSTKTNATSEFRNTVKDWIDMQLSDGGKLTRNPQYDFLQNANGVWLIDANYAYTNRNGVDLISQFIEIWDAGIRVNIAINMPYFSDERLNKLDAEITGQALKSIEIR